MTLTLKGEQMSENHFFDFKWRTPALFCDSAGQIRYTDAVWGTILTVDRNFGSFYMYIVYSDKYQPWC